MLSLTQHPTLAQLYILHVRPQGEKALQTIRLLGTEVIPQVR